MDYRNIPWRLTIGGLDLVHPPETLIEGRLTRSLNLRPNSEEVVEGRLPTKTFLVPQKNLIANGVNTPAYPYFWDITGLSNIKYIGSIILPVGVSGDPGAADGYFTYHNDGNSGTYSMAFIGGAPLALKSTISSDASTPTPFSYGGRLLPPTNSVVTATAPNGLPVIIIAGKYWVLLKDCNLHTPPTSYTGSSFLIDGLSIAGIPVIYAYKLGLPKPGTVTASVGAATGLSGTYYYRVTGYNSSTGFESPVSEASASVTVSNQKVSLSWTSQNEGAVNKYRIWRLGGTVASSWRLVTTVDNAYPTASTTYTDSTTDATVVLNETPKLDLVESFTSINTSGVTTAAQKFTTAFGPFLGKYVFWVGDPVRKSYLYWNSTNDLGRHDPSLDVNSVSDSSEELQNGFIWGSTPFVFSRTHFYGLDYGGEDAVPKFVPREIPMGVGIAGKHAFTVTLLGIIFVGRDGVYVTDGQPGPPISLTDDSIRPLFRGQTVGGIHPIDFSRTDEIRMSSTSKEVHLIYPDMLDGSYVHLVYDLQKKIWGQFSDGTYSVPYANEISPYTQILFGYVTSKSIYSYDDINGVPGEEAYVSQFRSGSWDSGIPLTHKEFGVLMLDFDPRGVDITITPYYDSEGTTGTSFTTDTSDDFSGRRVATFSLGDVYAKSIAFDISWASSSVSTGPKLYQGVLLFREDEENIVHWEHPPQSLGVGGLYHVKDSYWGLRSTAAVTLTVNVDGKDYVYSLPSTAGARSRLYLEFLPSLGKNWGFKLDSSQPFRFYGEDSALMAKPWQVDNSYTALSPFGVAGYPPYLRKEGGT